MKIEIVDLEIPEQSNIIVGYSHFIKTVEDLYEIVVTTAPEAKFGIAFSEASGKRLIRYEGNDQTLVDSSIEDVRRIAAGHTFIIILRNAYPINLLNQIKLCQEVGGIFAATANPLKVIVARDTDRAAIIGVMDGSSPVGVESDADKTERREFLRNIGYKK